MTRRNIIGLAVSFLAGLLLGGIGTIIMVLRECWQSYRHGFEIETDDVVRYALISSIGAVINTITLLLIC